MKNPLHYCISEKIETGSVYYFQEERLSSDEPHYFIVLNRNPRTEEFLILVSASSQVDKSKRIAKYLRFPEKTLVVVSPSEYPTFKKESVINCNSIFEKTTQSLIDKLEKKQLKLCERLMPKEIIEKLIGGTLASDQVSERVRKMLLGI